MEERLKGEEYEMFEAYDGKQLNEEKLEELGAGILKEWQDPYSGRNVTWGEVGCALSHYSVYENCIRDNIEVAVILEDDVIIPDDFSTHINYCLNCLKAVDDWEFCYLGRKAMDDNDVDYNEKFLKPGYSYWLCAYIINLKGMKKVVDAGMKKNLITPDEVLPIVAQSSPYKDYYKYYNLQEPLKMYSLKKLSCRPEPNAFQKSETENTKEIEWVNDNLLILATGTDMTDGLKRFILSCKTYGLNYKIMGLGTKWGGGDMANGPGGGQKINLLLEALSTLDDNQLVLVTDSYDVIMSANATQIIEKYKKFDKPVIFASESSCWPDRHKANLFPKISNRKNLYLNSGGFIGDVKNIRKIISSVPSNSDDQRWYTDIFLGTNNTNNSSNGITGPAEISQTILNTNIALDYNCEIFQCLNDAETELEINFSKSLIYNKITNTHPCQIHGNGPPSRKKLLNKYENYLMRNWSSTWGFNTKNEININELGDKLIIYIHKINTGNNTDITTKMNTIIKENINEVKKYIPNIEFIFADKKIGNNYNAGLKDSLNFHPDYYWLIDFDFVITNKNTLLTLLKQNRGIISPMFKIDDNNPWSNFWGEICENGWYKKSFDYLDIINYDKSGCWNVPHVSGNLLIQKEYLPQIQEFYNNTSGNGWYSKSMNFCYNCRKNNISMYVVNLEKYGYIIETKDEIPDDAIHRSLYKFETNPDEWAKKYLHPDFYNSINNWEKLPVEEPCKWAFDFPFVSDLFCEQIIDEANRKSWSAGGTNQTTKDNRINNVENIPTQDVHMKQIGFRKQWEAVINKYIAPLVSYLYSPYKTTGLNIAFVVKYEIGHQKELMPHHDSATYSTVVTLNRPGKDFTGGGTRFVKEDVTCPGKKGYCTIHPGRLTHYHEGLPITSGKRYIMVSFVY